MTMKERKDTDKYTRRENQRQVIAFRGKTWRRHDLGYRMGGMKHAQWKSVAMQPGREEDRT